MSTGWMPPFETVNVPPARSAGAERAVARPRGELGDARVDLLEREPVGAGDDRRDEPFGRVDGDGDVDLGEQLDSVSVDPRVEERVVAQRRGDELHDDRRDADRAASRPRSFSRAAQLDERLHVELEHRGQLGGGLEARRPCARAIVPRRPRSGIVPRDRRPRPPAPAGARRRRGPPPRPRRRGRGCARPGPEPVISRRVVEREAELLQQGARPRRDERRSPADGRAGRSGTLAARTVATGALPTACATVAPPPCADVAEERVAARRRASSLRRPRRPARERLVLLARLGDQPDRLPIGTVSPAATSRCTPARALGLDLGRRLLGLELEHDRRRARPRAPSATSHSVSRMSSVYAPSFGMITG